MISKTLLAAISVVAAICPPSITLAASTTFPQYDHLSQYRAAGENPYYHVNRYGYGNYVIGPNGAIGGYPAGSAGARELEIYQEQKCRVSPESC